jgi:hypothetical protein
MAANDPTAGRSGVRDPYWAERGGSNADHY